MNDKTPTDDGSGVVVNPGPNPKLNPGGLAYGNQVVAPTHQTEGSQAAAHMTADQQVMFRQMLDMQRRFAMFANSDTGRQITTDDRKTAERTQIGQKPKGVTYTAIGEKPPEHRPENYRPPQPPQPPRPPANKNGNTYRSAPKQKNGALTSAREHTVPDFFPGRTLAANWVRSGSSR